MAVGGTRSRGEVPLPALRSWLNANNVILQEPITCELVSGGRSNLTYAIRGADGFRVVLRRPPLDMVLATAHDMGREWRFISALRASAVAVPEPLAHEPSGAVLGVPFYVMSYIDGIVPHDAGCAEVLDLPARKTLAAALIDTMVELHRVDIEEVGLGDIARQDGYVERQLKRWKRQWDHSSCTDIKEIDEAFRRLSSEVPEQQRAGIVHGDLRPGNVICGPDGQIRAVLDWELATLGDPLADLAWLVSAWEEPAGIRGPVPPRSAPSALEGFPDRAWLISRYAERSGADVSTMNFYLAFAYWRSACISAGVLTRYDSGVMGDDGFDFSQLRSQVAIRANQTLELLERI